MRITQPSSQCQGSASALTRNSYALGTHGLFSQGSTPAGSVEPGSPSCPAHRCFGSYRLRQLCLSPCSKDTHQHLSQTDFIA